MKICFGVLALFVAAGSASAIDLTATPIDGEPGFIDRGGSTIFSAIPGPYNAFPAAAGSLGFDDYDSIGTGTYDVLDSMRFIGGVSTVGGQIRLDFFTNDGTPISNFTVTLPQAGNFNWEITNVGLLIPVDGIMQLTALEGTTGRWFLGAGAPTIGAEVRAFGGVPGQLSHRFELSVPAPGAAALLGLGGLLVGRRRR